MGSQANCNYVAKPLKLELRKPHPRWEAGDEVYGKDIDDAVRQCKQEIDKLLSPESGRGRAMIED